MDISAYAGLASAGVAGAVVTFTVMFRGGPRFLFCDGSAAAEALWGRLLALQGGIWGVSSVAGTSAIRGLVQTSHLEGRDWRWIAATVGAFAVFGFLLRAAHRKDEQVAARAGPSVRLERVGVFTVVGTCVALMHVTGMLIAGAAMNHLRGEITSRMACFLILRDYADGFLIAASVILTAGVLGTSAHRRAINLRWRGAPLNLDKDYYPLQYVLIFGIGYTFFLTIAYTPVALTALSTGSQLASEVLVAHAKDPDRWLSTQKDLSEVLRLGGVNLFSPAVATVLGPVIGALFAGVVGKTDGRA